MTHSIRCAHCKGTHQTVAEVRACSTPVAEQPTPEPTEQTHPCTCSWHDRCYRHRREAYLRGDRLAMTRAYND